MEIKELQRSSAPQSQKLTNAYDQLDHLLNELRKKELPDEIIETINELIAPLNAGAGTAKEQLKHVRKNQSAILKLINKELKLVTKNHYRNTWMAVGMSVGMTAFGIPLGLALGMSLDNMAFLGLGLPIGLPIGMAIGIAMGTAMDKKAHEEGRQLDLEVKY